MKYLPIVFLVMATAFVSCKKEPQGAVSGRWQETKLVIKVYSANVVAWDTTYLSPFTRFDYIQFNNNGTCAMVSDFYLIDAPGGLGYSKTTQTITPSTYNFDYSAYGSVYILTSPSNGVNFAGITTGDTVSIHGNTLLLHVVDLGPDHLSKSVFDSYFTRQ
ncbi:MAG: hypothetical protein ACHQIM_00195 [Sphingobacteriales bacterium]